MTTTARRLGRLELTLLLSMCMAIVALAIDVVLPALGAIRSEFGLSEGSTQAAAVVTAFLLGFALSQIVWGPLSDRFGRKPVMYAGFAIYIAAAVAAALAPSLWFLLVARFVWGVGTGGPRVVTLSVVRDTYDGEEMARAMSFIFAVFIVVPVVAPSLGAAILAAAGWRWIFAVCAAIGVVIAMWSRRLPETLRPENRLELSFTRIKAAAVTIATNRDTAGYTLALTFLFGIFSTYLASSEIIFDQVFGLGDEFPAIFGGIAIFMGIALLTNGRLVRRIGTRRLAHGVLIAYLVMLGANLAVALATSGRPPFSAFAVLLIPLLFCQALMLPNFNTIAMQPMARLAGTAASVIGAVSTAGGALLGAILDRAFDGTILPFAVGATVYGVLAASCVLVAERGRLFRPLIAGTGEALPDGLPPG
jgi:MFS transporter, DHA1 family, multidrug resistance protein